MHTHKCTGMCMCAQWHAHAYSMVVNVREGHHTQLVRVSLVLYSLAGMTKEDVDPPRHQGRSARGVSAHYGAHWHMCHDRSGQTRWTLPGCVP